MIYRGYLIKEFKTAYGVYAADNSKNFCIRNSEDECMDFVDQMKREQRAASKLFGGETYGVDDPKRFAKDKDGNTIVVARVGEPK
tara:strand:+ start:203 stop:457 length:255 start_codon:yes stop_codon:yes gene_type:complete